MRALGVFIFISVSLAACSGCDDPSPDASPDAMAQSPDASTDPTAEACRSGGGTVCGSACCMAGETCSANGCEPACSTVTCGGDCCEVGLTCHLGGCCRPEQACPTECCSDGTRCEEGLCRKLCPGGQLACGVNEDCCSDQEACVGGSCVALGAACVATAACATRPELTPCPENEVCDPGLGRCVPRITDPTCTFTPPPGVFEPRPLFTWGLRRERSCTVQEDCQTAERCEQGTCRVSWPHVQPGLDDAPEHVQATSIPMVTDLDGDCVPEIVFNTFRDSDFTGDGVLRAVRGDTGAKVWTVTDLNYRTDSTANPAIADVDGDGTPEVFVVSPGRQLLRIAGDGTPVWISDAFSGPEGSGSVTVSNLDGVGDAELVFGAAVFDSGGRLLFEGGAGAGFAGQGPIACVADLDGDDRPEIVAGRTVYETSGTVGVDFSAQVRVSASTPDGYCGLADFDGDGSPEIALVANGTIYILQGQTLAVLASLDIPGGGQGGAPNIADFDGDGRPDIGTAGASNYVVATYDPSGPSLRLLWRAPTEDDSSSRTGSSVFDFEGDGRAEVVYNDEEFLRIYPGQEPDCTTTPPGPGCDGIMTDAEVLFRDLNSSRTRTEYPVVADVDGDFKAEIVFTTSNEANFLDANLVGDAGLEVWADALDNWVATRPIWHQHAYAVTQSGPRAQVPEAPDPSWGPDYNAWRRNAQGGRDAGCAPDLEIVDVRQNRSACPSLALQVLVANRGCLAVGAGVEVELRDRDGVFDTVTSSIAIGPGALVRIESVTGRPRDFSDRITSAVDVAEAFSECREQNNQGPELEVSCSSGF